MSTPTETSPTQRHVDEVVESLERASTLLKRRTRDVLKLAYEREELIAAIENRQARVAPATLEPDHGTAIHGESAAPAPADVAATPQSELHDIEQTPDVVEPESAVTELHETAEGGGAEAIAPDPSADEPAAPVMDDAALPTTDVAPDPDTPAGRHDIDSTDTTDTSSAKTPAVDESAANTVESGFTSKWGHSAPEMYDDAPSDAPHTPAETPPPPASEQDDWGTAPDVSDHVETFAEEASSAPPWEDPDLEWSDEEAHVAPHDFPHPMPPVDASVLETSTDEDDMDDDATLVDSRHAEADARWDDDQTFVDSPHTDANARWDDDDEVPFAAEVTETTEDFDDSPFATEFAEHVEEVGGSLESSPFDLDTPPTPASYRPRSFQGDRSSDAMTASSLLEDSNEPEARSHEIENVAAAWDDFAGDQSPAPAPERGEDQNRPQEPLERAEPAPSSGSRLRDLVAKAQEEERVRTAQEKSDFDLINEDATVSRYDKNSAKLPTVGISSEELSSSVASLRSSFTSDKKSGSSSRDDDTGPSRADKRAEKRAAKEAAKAAKADAKRSRKQGT